MEITYNKAENSFMNFHEFNNEEIGLIRLISNPIKFDKLIFKNLKK